MAQLKEVSSVKCFAGHQKIYTHFSKVINHSKRFSVYLPPRALLGQPCPVLYWCTGVTTKEDDFIKTSSVQRYASKANMIIVVPDPKPIPLTIKSPKKNNNAVDFLVQFGWYLDAIQPPFDVHFKMYSYIVDELVPLIDSHFATITSMRAIAGHSMGGHGALIIGLRENHLFHSISCLAPQCAGSQFLDIYDKYFGESRELFAAQYDACKCIRNYDGAHRNILIDQGGADVFMDNLHLGEFVDGFQNINLSLNLRIHEGYSHSDGLITTFIGDHIEHHCKQLGWQELNSKL